LAAEPGEKPQRGAEVPVVAGFEAREGGKDHAVLVWRVTHGVEVHVVRGVEFGAGPGDVGIDGTVFGDLFGRQVPVNRGLHGEDAEVPPFAHGEFVDEMSFGEVAGFELETRVVDEAAELVPEFVTDCVDVEFGVPGFGIGLVHGCSPRSEVGRGECRDRAGSGKILAISQ
jgi:hypothetical protein